MNQDQEDTNKYYPLVSQPPPQTIELFKNFHKNEANKKIGFSEIFKPINKNDDENEEENKQNLLQEDIEENLEYRTLQKLDIMRNKSSRDSSKFSKFQWNSLLPQNRWDLWKIITCQTSFQGDEKNILNSFFIKRTRLRYIALCLIPLLIILTFVILYFLTSSSGVQIFQLDHINVVRIEVQNCRIDFKNSDEALNSIIFRYNLIKTYEFKEETMASFSENEKMGIILARIISESSDLKNCKLEVIIPSNKVLDNLDIDCFGNGVCVILREDFAHKAFEVNTLNIISESAVFVNIENLKAANLNFSVERGTIQINKFYLENAEITLKYGDVILQNDEDVRIAFQNEVQTFCIAAPFYQESKISNCYVADDGKTSFKFL